MLRSRSSCGPRYVGEATGCFSESFGRGVYCPSELSLFSRPPSWQLVRTPKVIRLHNTHTQFRSGTCSKTLPLGALHSLSLSRSVFRRIFCFFRLLSVFRRFASPIWPTPNFSPRWVPFRRFRCSRSHTEADRNCRFNTIFPFFVPLFRRLQEGTTFFFFLRGQFPLPLTGYDGHLFHRFLNGDHLSATQSGTFPFRGNFQAAAAPLLLLPCVARGLLSFSSSASLLARTHTHKHAPTQRARDGQLWLENAPFLANTSQNGHSPTTLRRVSTGGKSGFSHDTPLVPSSVVCGKTELFFSSTGRVANAHTHTR